MLYGLTAAVAWGISAIAATMAARRAGTYIAVLSAQGLGVVLLLLLTAILHPAFAAVRGTVALGLACAGLVGLLGYLAFYRAVEYGGPVGMVSAISATYGGVTTILAVVILGEHLGGYGTAGVVLAVGGMALAAARSQAPGDPPSIVVTEPIVGVAPVPSRATRLSRAGIPLAFLSALAYGVGGFLIGDFSARAGWLSSALVAHGASITVLLAAVPFLGRPRAWRGSASGVIWAAVAGLTDAVGLLAFSRGGEIGQVAVTAAVSSLNPVIPLIAGLVMFSEHLSRRQVFGVSLIMIGLVMLGLALARRAGAPERGAAGAAGARCRRGGEPWTAFSAGAAGPGRLLTRSTAHPSGPDPLEGTSIGSPSPGLPGRGLPGRGLPGRGLPRFDSGWTIPMRGLIAAEAPRR